MKYDLIFEKDTSQDDESSWNNREQIGRWKNESAVPRTGDGVFMQKGGWMLVTHVGFSVIEKGRRLVYITVK